MNPDADTNYVQLQQDSDGGMLGFWFVPSDQEDVSNYICQSPKIPISQKTTTPSTPPFDTTTTTTWSPFDTSTTTQPDEMTCMDGYEDLVVSTGKCYYISSPYEYDMLSRDDATAACDGMMDWDYDVDYNSENTKLVSINSDDENDELYSLLIGLDIDSAWIGLSGDGMDTNSKLQLFSNY